MKAKFSLLFGAALAAFLFTACLPAIHFEIPLPQSNSIGLVLDLNGADAQDFPLIIELGTDGRASPPSQNPVRAGYQFAGWFADSEGAVPFDFANTVITEMTVVYAKWDEIRWNLTFWLNDNTGGEYARQGVLNGFYAVWMSPPSRGAGWGFAGWFTDPSGTPESAFTFDSQVTTDNNLFAKWDADNYYIHYSRNYEGGAITSMSSPVSHGETLEPNQLNVPVERPGYTFAGWYTNVECTLPYTAAALYGDRTLYAKWTAHLYTVTFRKYAGSAEIYTVQAEYGKPLAHITPDQLTDSSNAESNSVLAPSNGWTARAGWGFIRWQNAQGTAWNFASPVTANMELVGLWGQNRYTVTLEGMNGQAPVAITNIPAGTTPSLGSNPTKAGHTFVGWYTNALCTTPYTSSAPLYSDITLYAKWTAQSYDVDFDAQGGSPDVTIQVPHGGRAVPPVVPPTKTGGNNFAGWWTDPAGGSQVDFTSGDAIITSDTTFYARWTTLPTHTVTFEYNGGQAVGSAATSVTRTVIEGQRVVPPAAPPIRSGSSFTGWYTADTGGSLVDFATDADAVITALGTTFYAQWATMVTVTLIDPDAPPATPRQVSHTMLQGSNFMLDTPTGWAGEFEGWYDNAAFATRLYDPTALIQTVTANMTLYARQRYTVTVTWTRNTNGKIYFPSSPYGYSTNTNTGIYTTTFSGASGVLSGTMYSLPYVMEITPIFQIMSGVTWQVNGSSTYANTNSPSPTVQVRGNMTITTQLP